MQKKIKTFYSLFMFCCFSSLIASTQKSEQLVDEAWKAWAENNQQLVEQKFLAAIDADAKNSRAYLGLSYLYNMQQKYDQSWNIFEEVLQIEENSYPYIFAAWATDKMRGDDYVMRPQMEELLLKLTEKADGGGVLKAMANETLGQYFQRKGDLSKSREYYQNMNTITDWMLIGPFENISASGYDNVFAPEFEYDAAKTYEGKNGVPAKWFKINKIRDNHWIDFRRYFAYFESVFYGNNFVYSPKNQTVQIRIGTSGSLKAFLNEELIVQAFDELNNDLDTYIVETELQEGWNRLLLKCGFSEIDQCNFMVRITDAQGEIIDGLTISTQAQSYKPKPGAPVKVFENFAEVFFKQKLKTHPDHLENYLLLADCYLRNDKAIEAEAVLRQAINLSSDCAALYYHILEAYLRGEKYDEYNTTLEKIFTLDKEVPYVLNYKIEQYLDNEEVEKAEELLKQLETLLPESEGIYQLYITIYGTKKLADKMLQTIDLAYKQFPTNWDFVYLKAFVSIQTTQKYDEAIKIFKEFIKKKYTLDALTNLADAYLRSGDIENWQKCYKKALQVDPAATGFYSLMANNYFLLQDYDRAEKSIKNALYICPNSPKYWSKLGDIYRIKNKIDLSKQAYRYALNYQPTRYDSRIALRELEGKKSIFSQFETANMDSLIAAAPTADAYPEDDAVVLLKDAKSVIYGRGASESSKEILVKIFNNNGIDAFKEYWINCNPYSQELIVEKAVVINGDGSELKADIDDNHIVFKSLEVNDKIYLKWKIKNFYGGKLAKHFWDSFYFNGYYPIKKIQYSLLLPENFNFNYKTQNMVGEPEIKQSKDGMLYQWSLKDVPAIEYEYYMPGLDDVGKMLYVSSIEDWGFLVDWYTDLARTKTRSSFEIKELLQKLFEETDNYSEKVKIEKICNFVTENVRYSSVSFRQSRFIPQKARDVLVNKIGDCKDMSALTITLLQEIGIEAHFVLLNTKNSGRNENILPSIAFNHCIVAIETKNGLLYFDPTANNFPFSTLPAMDVDGYSLLIKPGIDITEYLTGNNLIPNNIRRQSTAEIRGDSIFVGANVNRTGTVTASMRDYYRHKSQKEKEKLLTEILSRTFPNVKLSSFQIENLNELAPKVEYSYNFEVPGYVTESGQFKFLKIPWSDALIGNQALSYEKRNYPYYYWPRSDTLVHEFEIQLPGGYVPLDLVKAVNLTSSIADYSISYDFSNGVFKAQRMFINKKDVVSPEAYSEFKEFYNKVVKEDNKQILIKDETNLSVVGKR